MVEPGNLVPSQKPKVAAIFMENSRIMLKICNHFQKSCIFSKISANQPADIQIYLSLDIWIHLSTVTYIYLLQLVYMNMSAATCKHEYVCNNLYTWICLQQPVIVYMNMSAVIFIHEYVCSNLYTWICLQQHMFVCCNFIHKCVCSNIFLTATTCINESVCSKLYTWICLQKTFNRIQD